MKYLFAMIITALMFSGCGERVRVEQGQVGKVMNSSGLEEQIRDVSTFRLESCVFTACPKLITLDMTKNVEKVEGKFFMPKSDMEFGIELNLQYSAKNTPKALNSIFKEMPSVSKEGSTNINHISSSKLFSRYIEPIIIDTTRQALGNYTIEEIMSNLEETRQYIYATINKKLENEPIQIDTLSFSKIEYPALILKKKEDFASIDTQKATDMKAMAAELEILAKKLELEKAKAKMQLEVDEIVSGRMNGKMVAWGIVQAIQTSAEKGTPWALGSGAFQMLDIDKIDKSINKQITAGQGKQAELGAGK